MLQRGFITKYAPYLEQATKTEKPGELARRLVEFVEDVNGLVRTAQQDGRRQTRRQQQRRKGAEADVPVRPASDVKRAAGRGPKKSGAGTQASVFELDAEVAG